MQVIHEKVTGEILHMLLQIPMHIEIILNLMNRIPTPTMILGIVETLIGVAIGNER